MFDKHCKMNSVDKFTSFLEIVRSTNGNDVTHITPGKPQSTQQKPDNISSKNAKETGYEMFLQTDKRRGKRSLCTLLEIGEEMRELRIRTEQFVSAVPCTRG